MSAMKALLDEEQDRGENPQDYPHLLENERATLIDLLTKQLASMDGVLLPQIVKYYEGIRAKLEGKDSVLVAYLRAEAPHDK